MNKSLNKDKHQIINEDKKLGIKWNYILITSYIINLILLIYVYFKVKFNIIYFILITNAVIFTGIRSLYPVLEGKNICMYDILSPFTTRTCATIAEISFGTFLILVTINILIFVQKQKKNNILKKLEKICYFFIFLPVIANMNCWMGVSTNLSLFNSIEESLWTFYAILLLVTYLLIFNNINKKINNFSLIRNISVLVIIILILYILYMIFIDVPMYIKRYIYINSPNDIYKLSNGISDMFKCKLISNKYSDWNEEILWMTSYFVLLIPLLIYSYYINSKFI